MKTQPIKDIDKAKRIISAFVEESGGELNGKVRLNKAFWWAHVYHQNNHEGLLSKYPITRLPEGPCMDQCNDLLCELEREGTIDITIDSSDSYPEYIIRLVDKNLPPMDSDDRDSICNALEWVKDKSATQLSNESHLLSHGWQQGRDGDIIDIAGDAVSEEEKRKIDLKRESLREQMAETKDLVNSVFGV